jgi:hypothetical protein
MRIPKNFTQWLQNKFVKEMQAIKDYVGTKEISKGGKRLPGVTSGLSKAIHEMQSDVDRVAVLESDQCI